MSGPRIVVAGWLGSTNLGDELIFAGITRVLTDMGASIVAVSTEPGRTNRDHGVVAVPMSAPELVATSMAEADLVLWGGGSLVQDVTSSFNLPYHLSKVVIADRVGTTVLPYGIDVGPITTRMGKALCRLVLPLMAPGLVRDAESVEEFEELGGARPSFAPDLAFALQPPRVRGEDRIIVCLRPWSGGGSRLPVSRSWQDDLQQTWFLDSMAAALDDIVQRTHLPVHFLAMQEGRDDVVHQQVAERMRSATTQDVARLDRVLGDVARSRVVITMRYHGMVAAVLGGRPTVGINYTDKMRRLSEAVGPGGSRITDWSESGIAALPDLVGQVLGTDADVIDVREDFRQRMIRARSVIERTLYAVG